MSGAAAGHGERFVRRPRPRPLESHDGYIIRVAEENGYPSARYVSDRCYGAQTSIWVNKGCRDAEAAHRTSLERLLDLPSGEFDRRWPMVLSGCQAPTLRAVGALELQHFDLRLGAADICPACVREDGHASVLWEVRYVTACPRHRRVLISHCPSCGTRLSSHRARLLVCQRCQTSLDKDAAVGSLPDGEVALAAAVKAAAAGVAPDLTRLSRFGPLFESGLHAGFETLRVMANLAHEDRGDWLAMRQAAAGQRHRDLMTVLGLFEEWPTRWEVALAIRMATPMVYNRGLRAVYRREIELFERDPQVPQLLRDAFTRWLLDNHPVAGTWPDIQAIVGDVPEETAYLTVNDAAARLGLCRNSVMSLVKDGTLVATRDVEGSNEKALVTRESLEGYEARRSENLTFKAAAERLGVTPRTLKGLVVEGVLTASLSERASTPCIAASSVEAVLSSIESAINRGNRKDDDLSLTAALAMILPAWRGVGALLRHVLEGRVAVRSFSREQGLSSLRVSKMDVRRLLGSIDSKDAGHWLTFQEAANFLRIHRPRLHWLLDHRVLEAKNVSGTSERRWRVSHAVCQDFQSKYVTLMELVVIANRSIYEVRRRLEWANIKPASLGSGHTNHGFFPRAQAEKFVRDRFNA